MEKEEFEKTLMELPKPNVEELRHETILGKAIVGAKDRAVLSFWWLIVPGYVIAAFLMKSLFMRQTTFWSEIRSLVHKDKTLALLFFLAMPVLVLLLNIASIRRVYFLSGNSRTAAFFRSISGQIIMIVLSTAILILYSIEII